MQWTHKPQEREGTYMFSGKLYLTQAVRTKLTSEEIMLMYMEVQCLVKEHNGLDYLQIFENKGGEKLYLIDELNREMIATGKCAPEDNHCTLLFSWEY